jgi:hypothetical protein
MFCLWYLFAMRSTEHVYRWEVDDHSRRLDRIEERLARRDQERMRNTVLLFWFLWAAMIAAMAVVAAQS